MLYPQRRRRDDLHGMIDSLRPVADASAYAPASGRAPQSMVVFSAALGMMWLGACASPVLVDPPTTVPTPTRGSTTIATRAPRGLPSERGDAAVSAATAPLVRWPIKTAEHVDLWLHAFALVSNDSARMPLYRRGYRDSLVVVKNRLGVFSSLDKNRYVLGKALQNSPEYERAQFFALEVPTWAALRATVDGFLQVDGETQHARDKTLVPGMVRLAAIFKTPADREWLRIFVEGVGDEQVKFFAADYSRSMRSRAAVVTAVDALWQGTYRQRFERFLSNTGQRNGDIVLSSQIGSEGRMGPGRDRQIAVVVPFPQRVDEAADVLFVFAHEVCGPLVAKTLADNLTATDGPRRTAEDYVATGQVRLGAMLLDRIAPELYERYVRYYLAQHDVRVPDAMTRATLNSTFSARFPLPTVLEDVLRHQLEAVLGGI